jgi:lipid-binding SYLF domain-containing protein
MAHRTLALSALMLTVMLMGCSLMAPPATAQSDATASSSSSKEATPPVSSKEATAAQMRVNDAVAVIGRMKGDPNVSELLQGAKGLLIVPHFIKGGLLIGGQGGAGLLLVRRDGRWSDPAFYKTGGGSFGAQIGGVKGSMVMILMSDKAVESFQNKASTWSFSADAGLTAVNYKKEAPESATLSDVVVWTDTKGLFGGAVVGATNISRDDKADQAYYNHADVTTQQILGGVVANPNSNILRDVLPTQLASKK